jgi:hypothetical protein
MKEEGRLAFARRLNQAFDNIGMPVKQKGRYTAIAKLFSVTPVAAKDWCDGANYPTVDKLVQIAQTVKRSTDWLLFGQSLSHDRYVSTPEGEFVLDGARINSRRLVGHLAFDRVWLAQSMDPDQVVLIAMDGDAMEPSIQRDSLLLLNLAKRSIDDSGVYVFRFEQDETLIVRRAHRHVDGSVEIGCDNAKYRDHAARMTYKDGRFLSADGSALPLLPIGKAVAEFRLGV